MLNPFKQKGKEVDTVMSFHTTRENSIETLAKSLAQKGMPMAENDLLSKYTSSYTQAYKGLLAEQLRSYAGDHDRMAQAEKDALQSKSARIEKQLEAAREKERTLNLDREAVSADYHVRNNWPMYLAIVILAFGEAIISKSALSIFEHSNNLYQFFILAFLTAVYILLPAMVIMAYRATEEKENKILIRIGLAMVVIGGFFVIAILRTTFLQNIGLTTMSDVKATSSLPIKPIYWIGLNLFFLAISVYCASMIETTDERKNNSKAKNMDDRLAKLSEEIQNYERELDAIPDRLYGIEQRLNRQKSEGETVRQRIESLHASCINSFITTNSLFRTDGVRPTCFNDPIPSLL